jgi:putative resolvase
MGNRRAASQTAKDAPRCILYARVSSAKPAGTGHLSRPKARLLDATRMRGYDVVATIAEQASGLKEKRRDLRRLCRLAQEGQADVVRVESKDRLAGWALTLLKRRWPLMASGWKCWMAR